MVFGVGFGAYSAPREAGDVTDPSFSVPRESGLNPEATPTAEPEEEPPGAYGAVSS